MVSDDERREVAERLRCLGAGEYVRLYEALGLDIVDVMEDERGVLVVYNRLADLIDPESGQNLDTNRDSVPKESPAVQKAPETCEHWLDGECYALRTARPVDREALLALAGEMDHPIRQAVWNQTAGVRREHVMAEYARRIREACGEVVE